MTTQPFPQIPGLNLNAFLSFSQNPEMTEEIFKVQQGLAEAPNRKEMLKSLVMVISSNLEFMKMFEESYAPAVPTTEELLAMPTDSLGHQTGVHLRTNGIHLDFPGLDSSVFHQNKINPVSYLGMRALRNHDVYHTVLGLSVSPLDEYYLCSFQLAQFSSPYHMALMTTGYLHTTFYQPENISVFLENSHRYYELGKKAQFFPSYRFEDNWLKPLTQVKKELRIE